MQMEQPQNASTNIRSASSNGGQQLQSGFLPNIEVNRTPQIRVRKKSLLKQCFEKVMPFTSTLAMMLILYIIKAYLLHYVPIILAIANDPQVSELLNKGLLQIYIETAIFTFLSFSCFYILVFKLWFKCLPMSADPGYISRKLEDHIFKQNGITREMIGTQYNYNQVALICTYNYFVRQGLIKISNHDDEERISITSDQTSNLSHRSSSTSARSSDNGSYGSKVRQSDSGMQIEMTDVSTQDSPDFVNQQQQQALRQQQEQIKISRQHVFKAIKRCYSFAPGWMNLEDLLQYRYCKSCNRLKPPRAHHCSICGKCVLRMDHHCPWVGRCVGHHNYKLFYQFLIYTVVGNLFACLTMGFFVSDYIGPPKMSRDQKAFDQNEIKKFLNQYVRENQDFTSLGNIRQASGVCLGLTIGLSLLLFQHTFFIWTSTSSIEYGVLLTINPFFQGEKDAERKMFQEHQTRQRNVEQMIEVQQNNQDENGNAISGLQSNVEVKTKSFLSFFCSTQCIATQCSFSRDNFYQVFEKGKILSWFLPLGIKNESHNGYEWSLKQYSEGLQLDTREMRDASDDTNHSLITNTQ